MIKPATTRLGGSTILMCSVPYLRLEGIEFDGTNFSDTTVWGIEYNPSSPTEAIFDSLIVHDLMNSSTYSGSQYSYGIALEGNANVTLKNTLVYDVINRRNYGSSVANGVLGGSTGTIILDNLTVYSIQDITAAKSAYGIQRISGSMTVQNTYSGKTSGAVAQAFNGTITQLYNVSSDSTASGTGSKTGKSDYGVYFVEAGSTNTDLHLKNNSALLWGTKGTDLSADAVLPVSKDIDGETRAASPDIGADRVLRRRGRVLFRRHFHRGFEDRGERFHHGFKGIFLREPSHQRRCR